MASWTLLPEELVHTAVLRVGGKCLGDTARLREVCQLFRKLADSAADCHLSGDDAEMRLVALESAVAAAEHGNAAALQRVLGCVTDADVRVRKSALDALGYLVVKGDDEVPAVVEAATLALSDADDTVSAAARSLLLSVVSRGDGVALAAVVAAAAPGGARRPEALAALGSVAERGDKEAVAAICRGLDDSCDEVRREAVAALGEVAARGCPEATPLLSGLIMDPDVFVCQAALTACAVVAPRGHAGAVRALLARLEDPRPAVRGKALEALGVVSEPGAEVGAAAAPLLRDADDHVRGIAERVAPLLAPPAAEVGPVEFVLAKPPPIEGVKSKKAALARLEPDEAAEGDECADPCLALSLSSRAVLVGERRSRAAAMLGGELDDADEKARLSCWRRSGARVALVSRQSLSRLAEDSSGRTPLEVLLAAHEAEACPLAGPSKAGDSDKPEASASASEEAVRHLARFGIDAVSADAAASSLPQELLGRLAVAEAFWPKSPHVLALDSPEAWGLRQGDLEALGQALREYAGAVVLATEDAHLAQALGGDRWALEEDGLLRRCG